MAQLHRAHKALHTTLYLGVSAKFTIQNSAVFVKFLAVKFATMKLTRHQIALPTPVYTLYTDHSQMLALGARITFSAELQPKSCFWQYLQPSTAIASEVSKMMQKLPSNYLSGLFLTPFAPLPLPGPSLGPLGHAHPARAVPSQTVPIMHNICPAPYPTLKNGCILGVHTGCPCAPHPPPL